MSGKIKRTTPTKELLRDDMRPAQGRAEPSPSSFIVHAPAPGNRRGAAALDVGDAWTRAGRRGLH